MKKHTFYTEMAYIVGLVMLAVCTALMAPEAYGILKTDLVLKFLKKARESYEKKTQTFHSLGY